jgi:hypothetical protein
MWIEIRNGNLNKMKVDNSDCKTLTLQKERGTKYNIGGLNEE